VNNPFSNLKDELLMEHYLKGEAMAFDVIYSRYKSRVYTYLNRRVKDSETVNDIFQNTFIKFHKSRHLYNPKYPLLKWIYTICRSELLDEMKKKKLNIVEFNEELYSSTPKQKEDKINIDEEKTLTTSEKEAIKLRYFSDQDFVEISSILNTSSANVRKIISRGIQKLKTKYAGEGND